MCIGGFRGFKLFNFSLTALLIKPPMLIDGSFFFNRLTLSTIFLSIFTLSVIMVSNLPLIPTPPNLFSQIKKGSVKTPPPLRHSQKIQKLYIRKTKRYLLKDNKTSDENKPHIRICRTNFKSKCHYHKYNSSVWELQIFSNGIKNPPKRGTLLSASDVLNVSSRWEMISFAKAIRATYFYAVAQTS